MVKYYRIYKLCCAGTSIGFIVLYVLYLEPYCFFTKPLYSEGITDLAELKIYTYGPIRTSSSSKNLITILTPKPSSRILQILQLLDLNFADNFTTNLLILHTNEPHKVDLLRLTAATRRQILFLNIGNIFRLFPIGFDPCHTKTSYRVRGKWNYQLMIQFWFKTFFELPQLREYEYIMRLDDDSKLRGKWINVFDEMRNKSAVYFANNLDVDEEKKLPGTMNLKRVLFDYVKHNNITPKQPEIVRDAFGTNSVHNYYNNFEVTKVEFFRRADVRHWVETVESTYGIFKYRWGDAILRYLTVALFAEQQQVLHRRDYNMPYCHKC